MKITLFLLILLPLLFLPSPIFCGDYEREDDVLNFDEIPIIDQRIYLKNDNKIFPAYSDFELIYFAPMSDRKGNRWALVSVQNTSTGTRILTNKHILATFADGSKKFPKSIEATLSAGEFFSETIEFGNSRFPIVKVETRLRGVED